MRRLIGMALSGALMLVTLPAWGFDSDGLQVGQSPPPSSGQDVQLATKHFDDAIDLPFSPLLPPLFRRLPALRL
jgi:hypothetical protein